MQKSHPIRDLLIGEVILFALNRYAVPLFPAVENFIISLFRTIISDCGRWIAIPSIIYSFASVWMMITMKRMKNPAYWLMVVLTVLCVWFSVGVLFTKVEPDSELNPIQEAVAFDPFATPQTPHDPGF